MRGRRGGREAGGEALKGKPSSVTQDQRCKSNITVRSPTSFEAGPTIDNLYKWRLNVNKNAVIRSKLSIMFPDKRFSH